MRFNKSVYARTRRRGVIARLNQQLLDGKKRTKTGLVPLEDKDIRRINSELETLKTRI